MSRLATRRLIDAAAKLHPAERALLNLWVNRGLDDARLAQLTGLSPEALQTRRALIVERLSEELGLPPTDVDDALRKIAAGSGEHVAMSSNGRHDTALPATDASVDGVPRATAAKDPEPSVAADTVARPAAIEPVPAQARHRHRRVWLKIAALILVLVVVAIVAVAISGGAKHRAAVAKPTTATTSAVTIPIVRAPAATNPVTTTPKQAHIPTRTARGPLAVPLAGLPGGLGKAHGSVQLFGPLRHLRLKLRVRGLPRTHDGHYEVWLYNSVLDSRPLGRLRAGVHVVALRLPAQARRYRWIDISFQPAGAVYHSGESELRATNPAHTTKARLRKHAARRRHQLRRATKTRLRKHSAPRRRQPRRATKGSKQAKTSK
jgi:hypothetical protein